MTPESIAAAAALESDPRHRDPNWLRDSWDRPAEFLTTLQQWIAEQTGTAFKSASGAGHALYYDCVLRHLDAGQIALRWYDHRRTQDDGWSTLSFDALHLRCMQRAAAWTHQGVEPGAVVCTVLPFGVEAVISVLAGLSLGACVSLLEPRGPDYVSPRLEAIAPQHIATEAFYAPLLGAQAAAMLDPQEPATTPTARAYEHTYDPQQPCALLLSPLRRPRQIPVPLTGDEAYMGILRDGTLTLALRAGDAMAAPGFDVEQHQPALLLATLGAGATFVHIPPDDALRDPSLLDVHPLRTVGLTAAMGEALLAAPSPRRHRWDHVFKNPEEPTDWEAWRDLVQTHGLDRTAMSNVIFEAASGGALLSSPRRNGTEHLQTLMNVVPAPGRPWTLLDFSRTGQRSVGEVGIYAPSLLEPSEPSEPSESSESSEPTPTDPQYIALGRRRDDEYLYGGTIEPRRSGRVYPAQEVLAALEDCPFLDGASITTVAAGGSTLAQRFVLLGFLGHESDERFAAHRAAREAELLRMLSRRLGEDLLPDHIELFPLHARRKEDAVDHDWCQHQYVSGALFQKARTPMFRHMAALRQTTR